MDRSEIDSLKAELRRMQQRVEELETAGEEPTNRRNMLRGLGAAAAGAAVGGLAFARPASAAPDLSGNADNVMTNPTTMVRGPAYVVGGRDYGLLHLTDDLAQSDSQITTSALTIAATGTRLDVGAKISGSATGVKLSGPVPLKLNTSNAPSQSIGSRGQFIHNNGDLWFCVSASGTNRWRRITGAAGAGGFVAITPTRVYDSRAPLPTPGALAQGANRLVSIASGRDSNGTINALNIVPASARAITAVVTITGTEGNFGFLVVNPGGISTQTTSVINWTAPGQTIANGLTLTLNTNREVTVVNGSGGGNTGFFIDVSGYFL